MATIFINKKTDRKQYIALGTKPYSKPETIQFVCDVIDEGSNQIKLNLDNTQKDGTFLDLVVKYELYHDVHKGPEEYVLVEQGSTYVKEGRELKFQNLKEGTSYVLKTGSYNPYYPDMVIERDIHLQTKTLNIIDLSLEGPLDQERDNLLTLYIPLEDNNEQSIELQNVQKLDEEPILKLNLDQKELNNLCKIEVQNIPDGLYNLTIIDKNRIGLSNLVEITKYDKGKTINNEIKHLSGKEKTVAMINFGKIVFSGGLIETRGDVSSLSETKIRRNGRRGLEMAVPLATMSFWSLGASSNAAGND